MAKMKADKSKTREKKVSRGAVEKSTTKDKKSKRADTPPSSDDESSDSSGEASVKAEKKNKKSKKAETTDTTTATPLFIIDTKPTPVNLATTAEATSEDEDSESSEKNQRQKQQPPPSGLNRATRRRIMLIERQREAICKKLGVADPQSDEVQKELATWTTRYDQKAAAKLEKARVRKAKEAARLKSKTGRALTGRRLKEREKLSAGGGGGGGGGEKAAVKKGSKEWKARAKGGERL